MKHIRILSLIIALILTLSVCAGALAATVPDNPAGTTVAEIAEGDTMNTNNGTVTDNNGTVTDNNGTVTNNNGTVTNNDGIVNNSEQYAVIETNKGNIGITRGTVVTNTRDGNIVSNNGTVETNYGGIQGNIGNIEENAAGATVGVNNGTIETNGGIVTNNDGSISGNTLSGTVTMTENGTVQSNAGTLYCAEETDDGFAYGEHTYRGVTYASDKKQSKTATCQWVDAESSGYTVLSYKEALGKLPRNKKFVRWEDANGNIYFAGDVIDDPAALCLTAKLRKVKTESVQPGLDIAEDGSMRLTGAKLSDLLELLINGVPVPEGMFTFVIAEDGSFTVTLAEEFAATLTPGAHEAGLHFNNGDCAFIIYV